MKEIKRVNIGGVRRAWSPPQQATQQSASRNRYYDLKPWKQCRLDLKFSELTRMPVYGKGMKRIGKVTDIEFGLKDRLITELVVKVDGEDAKKAWKGRLHLRSPKISIPAELVSGVKDAILLQCTLEEMKSSVKKV